MNGNCEVGCIVLGYDVIVLCFEYVVLLCVELFDV